MIHLSGALRRARNRTSKGASLNGFVASNMPSCTDSFPSYGERVVTASELIGFPPRNHSICDRAMLAERISIGPDEVRQHFCSVEQAFIIAARSRLWRVLVGLVAVDIAEQPPIPVHNLKGEGQEELEVIVVRAKRFHVFAGLFGQRVLRRHRKLSMIDRRARADMCLEIGA